MENENEPRPFTGQITAIVTGEASHPELVRLSPAECDHLGITQEASDE